MITNFSGMNDNNKPSSKVLRPPGGGSSDIFGADMPSSTARNVKNHMQSNIFSDKNLSAVKNNGGEPRRGQKNVDSYARLFGEPERPFTPGRNHMKSNIQFGGNSQGGNVAAATTLSNGNGHHHVAGSINGKNGGGSVLSTSSSSSVSSSTENLKMNGISKTDGNPVTGEGYKPSDINSSIPSLNGANQVINKNRIPPGGFSSGLW